MADDEAEQRFYLSSLDPGVGKTQSILHFLQALLASQEHRHVGAVVFVFTKDEIRTLAREAQEAGLPASAFAARVNKDDEEVNLLGCGDPERAPILFTTQQRLMTICSGRRFSEVNEFRYRGQLRQVRIWDEALLPARSLSLSGVEIAGLYPHLPRGEKTRPLTDALDELRHQLDEAEDRTPLDVPDLAYQHQLPAVHLQRHLRDRPSETRELAFDLWHLLGRKAIVCHDDKYGPKLVSFREHLPPDLAPLVILDASGRVATTYEWWKKARQNLVELKPGAKQYRNLTIRIWGIGGGRSSFSNDGGKLRRRGIVETIKKKPSEPWLVVCHKIHEKWLTSEITTELPNAQIQFIHWGMHRATNEFRDIPNVILAGTLFLPHSAIEGLGRAALGLVPERGLLTTEQHCELFLGTQADEVLQAVCRASARKAIGGDCGRCDVYLIAHQKHGIAERLPVIFPGCTIEEWSPVPRKARGKVAKALAYVRDWLNANPNGLLPFTEVRRAIGEKDASNFNKLRRHQDFLEGLEAENIEVDQPGRYARGFRRALEDPPTDGDFEDYFPPEDDSDDC